MTFRIWKSSGLINHLFFFPLFLLTPLFFEHLENLSVPLFAPRTPFTLRRGSRQLRPSPALFSSRPQKLGLSVAHASPKLRHRLFFSFGRGKPSASRSLTPRPVTISNTPHLPCANPHPAAVFRQYPSIPVNTLTHEIIALQRNH